jgi:hypothetical protein
MSSQQRRPADEPPQRPELAADRRQPSHLDDVGGFLLPEKAMARLEVVATVFIGAIILVATIILAVMLVR